MGDETNLPPVLTCTEGVQNTFVFATIKERWPTIVGRVIDHFHCKRRWFLETYGQEADADVKSVIAELSEMRYRMMTNKPLKLFTDNFDDVEMWNNIVVKKLENASINNDNTATWFYDVWLFVECYLYRRLFGTVWKTKHLKSYDMFADQKNEGFDHHADQIKDSLLQLCGFLEVKSEDDSKLALEALVKQCLWGNRCDLSLSGGTASVHANDALHDRDRLVVVNHMQELIHHICSLKTSASRRIDFILDNAGMELVCDLLLAYFLLSQQYVDTIVFHMKMIPWFVSDVVQADWDWTLTALGKLSQEGKNFTGKLNEWLQTGAIKLEHHLFWTSPHSFYLMNETAPDLYNELKNSQLLIFKGDLNYRKLVGDRMWPYTTSFKAALCGFLPAPLVALRTLKAETICGLSKETEDDVLAEFGEKNDWLVSGTHAVIQMML